ncbi:MAG: hypothetical protein WA906_05110 [Pacificimonas sp.]
MTDMTPFSTESAEALPDELADFVVRPNNGPKRRLRTKDKHAAELVLTDGTTLAGHVFVGLGDRILDCLNDKRPFFPFLAEDGEMLLLAKASIAVCRPLEN